MARVMLENQFAAGLRQEMNVKVARVDENLLSTAKFEEAEIVPSRASSMRKLTGYSRGHDHQSNNWGLVVPEDMHGRIV